MLTSHYRLARAIAAWSCAAGLAACGGGGGSSGGSAPVDATKLGISGSNYEVVSRAAVSSMFFLDITSGRVVGAEVSSNPQLLKMIIDAVRHGMQVVGGQQALLTGAAVSTPCAGGGSYDVTVDDKNGNQAIDAGDSFAIDYKSCKGSSGGVTFGRISVAADTMSGDFFGVAYSATLSITTSGYGTLYSDGLSTQGEGNFKVTFSRTPAGVADMSLAIGRFVITSNTASLRSVTTLADTQLTQHSEAVAGHWQVSNTVSGKLASSELGNQQVSISTLQPLLNVDGEAFYSSGQLLVRGNGSSALRLTAVDGHQVRLELDGDGDGSYEAQKLKSWVELM